METNRLLMFAGDDKGRLVSLTVARGQRHDRKFFGDPTPGWLMPAAGMFLDDSVGGRHPVLQRMTAEQWFVPFGVRHSDPTPEELLPANVAALGLPSLEQLIGRRIAVTVDGEDVVFTIGGLMYLPYEGGPDFQLHLWEDRTDHLADGITFNLRPSRSSLLVPGRRHKPVLDTAYRFLD